MDNDEVKKKNTAAFNYQPQTLKVSSTDGGRDTRGKLSWVSDRASLSCESAPHVVKLVFLHKLKASCYAKVSGGFVTVLKLNCSGHRAVPWKAWGFQADWISLTLAKIKRPSHGGMWQHLTELCPKSTERRPKPLVLSFAVLLMTKCWQVPICCSCNIYTAAAIVLHFLFFLKATLVVAVGTLCDFWNLSIPAGLWG